MTRNHHDAQETEPKKNGEVIEQDTPEENAADGEAQTPDQPDSTEEPTAQLAMEKDRYLRLAAEYDNYRKRSQKEREAFYGTIQGETILQFLPVYDNLERALKQETSDPAFYKGVEMIMQQLKEILEKLGVSEISAAGEPFDPALHNAVSHIEDSALGNNEIAEEFQKGFKLGDKVIRFSMVKVAN